jgi:hypothetical protein
MTEHDEQNEYEERIWFTERQGGLPIVKYCKEVTLLVADQKIPLEGRNIILKVKNYFESLNIPTTITTRYRPYGKSVDMELEVIQDPQINFNNWKIPTMEEVTDLVSRNLALRYMEPVELDNFLKKLKGALKVVTLSKSMDSYQIIGCPIAKTRKGFQYIDPNYFGMDLTYLKTYNSITDLYSKYENREPINIPILLVHTSESGSRKWFEILSGCVELNAAFHLEIKPRVLTITLPRGM